VFCADTDISREDVLSRWFMKRWDTPGNSPFGVAVNGDPLLTRAEVPVRSARIWPVMVPVCKACNNELDRLIEKPAKPAVRRLLNDMGALTTVEEVAAVARWAVKVLVLEAHPEASHTALASHQEREKRVPGRSLAVGRGHRRGRLLRSRVRSCRAAAHRT
jgi:hypothetical protein